MKHLISSIYTRFRNLILYGVIGSCTSLLDFLVYTMLTSGLGVYYLFANCISVVIGITTSFVLNRYYNFKVKDRPLIRFFSFFTVGILGMLLSNLILYISVEEYEFSKIVSKLLSIIIVVFFQFLLNKYLTFKTASK